MRILRLRADSCSDGSAAFVDIHKYEVVDVVSFDEALWFLAMSCFDAVLIDDGGDPGTVQFVVDTRAVCPDVPVFVTSAWGADLAAALSAIAAVRGLPAA